MSAGALSLKASSPPALPSEGVLAAALYLPPGEQEGVARLGVQLEGRAAGGTPVQGTVVNLGPHLGPAPDGGHGRLALVRIPMAQLTDGVGGEGVSFDQISVGRCLAQQRATTQAAEAEGAGCEEGVDGGAVRLCVVDMRVET